jgi:large subunit ribosomal protein L17
MVTSLLEHERIETTDAKAKEVRRWAERMITLGKRGTLHARRRALRVIRRREVAAKVFDDLAERYRDRPGGYTRVVKLRNRVGDAAAISIVELVEPGEVAAAKEEKPSRGRAARKKGEADEAPARKKRSAKKTTAEKTTAKKTTAKKTTAKKTTAKKTTAKKTTAKKTTAKKTTAKKTTAKKTTAKKTTGKKASAEKKTKGK